MEEPKTWNEISSGTVNRDAGNALENFTSSFRKGEKPEFNETNCIHCFFCWVFCPDDAILCEDEQVTGINYNYCKGCGICVNECPVKQEPKPLEMVKDRIEI